MPRLTYRSLLLSTVISFSPITTYGSALDISERQSSSPSQDHLSNIPIRAVTIPNVTEAQDHSAAEVPTVRSVERPTEHFCPITQELMREPVVAEDGFSYEKEAILKWLQDHSTSPMTRQPMNNTLHPNQSLRLLIAEWNPDQTYRPSALEELSPEEIIKLINDEFAKNVRLLQPEHTAKDKDIVVFLGNTGAGKSTLINFLAEKRLNVIGARYALVDASDKNAMPIGMKLFQSETLYPKSIDIKNLRFFDLPGFKDTDGSVRNLVNAAFIRRILLEAKSVRCVYVAGQDQFTADGGASINTLTQVIQRLFVMSDNSANPVSEGLLVITKEDQTLNDLITANLEDIPQPIGDWRTNNRIDRMYHSSQDTQNSKEHRQQLHKRIEELSPLSISTLNVSALYPPETAKDLKRMFSKMFSEAYAQKKTTPITTVSEYETHIADWKKDSFWEAFENGYFKDVHPSVTTLSSFATIPYLEAREEFVPSRNADRDAYIEKLEKDRKDRVLAIEKDTEARAEAEINAVRAAQGIDGVIPFDFANHVQYRDRVIGEEALQRFTLDSAEHEIARKAYKEWVTKHNQDQLDKSSIQQNLDKVTQALQKQKTESYAAIKSLEQQLIATRQRLYLLEIKLDHAAPYRRFLKGKLVYRPNKNSIEGQIILPIVDLKNPLNSKFDLTACGDASKYLHIATGYPDESLSIDSSMLTIWIGLRCFAEKDENALKFYASSLSHGSASIGTIWEQSGKGMLHNFKNNADKIELTMNPDVGSNKGVVDTIKLFNPKAVEASDAFSIHYDTTEAEE